ncbi:MAG: hypothetical protein AB1540_16370, partial [Bdellovibrionota bacterium]
MKRSSFAVLPISDTAQDHHPFDSQRPGRYPHRYALPKLFDPTEPSNESKILVFIYLDFSARAAELGAAA